jgi:hypothetical protein
MEFLHDVVPHDIGSSEEPATSGALLTGDRASLKVQIVVEDVRIFYHGAAINESGTDILVRQDSSSKLSFRVGGKLVLPALEAFSGNGTISSDRDSDVDATKG